ncbi:MAG: hypothetical protein R3327_01905 [Nitrosopumilaceae archaeon]|nr:hypothetical protein [Nitrosopumilaceae archaeon]
MSDEHPSFCDIMKDNTSTVIKKMESQLPINFQMYSDIYKEYFHILDDLFGTCYIIEREGFDKTMPPTVRQQMESYVKYCTEFTLKQIENYNLFLNWYSKMRISGMRNYEVFAHIMIENYGKFLKTINSNFEKMRQNK